MLTGYRYPQFGKYTQEDSHEVLRCLLTEMKNEELEVTSLKTMYV